MKRIADTSREALAEIAPSIPAREMQVLDTLRDFNKRGDKPTAYEITTALLSRGAIFDLNSVRPRLTELKDKGRVRVADKRLCSISGRKVYTWEAVA